MSASPPEYAGEPVEIRGHLLREGFAPIPHRLIRTKRLSPKAKVVLFLLLSRNNAMEQSWEGHDGLATHTGLSRSGVIRGLEQLAEFGIVEWRRRGQGKTNIYTVSQDAIEAFLASEVSG
jgi:hypothetical protein